MPTPSVADLKDTWTRRNVATSDIGRAGIRRLADGKPVTAAAMAKATNMSVADVTSHLENAQRYGIEIEDGAVVGAALTLRPTEHRFRIRGNDLYTWCGFDALFIPIIVGDRAEVASTCPVTGTRIRLTVEADGNVSAVTPASTVVAIVGQDVMSSCTVIGPNSAVCTQMPFFASPEAAERWLPDHPGVAVVDLEQAREITRASVADAWLTGIEGSQSRGRPCAR